MKFVSWNVNGLRACIQKGFLDQFQRLDADFFCLQETKLSASQLELDLPGYEQYWCYAEKKGYSGTAIFTKHHPLSVSYGIDQPELDNEGRVITLEYQEFYLVTCYTPNAQRGLARLGHRMTWDEAFRGYLQRLDQVKPVVLCGDLNVAHKEIDLKNPSSNRGNAGFSDEERENFQKTLDLGFTDTFRHLYPDAVGRYSWWSYMFHARENNAGWRIDYFLTSNRMEQQIQQADILSDILGSDHCPVMLELDTLVNGSIWSASAGKPSVIEKEPTKKKASKASPVNGKALALLCLLFACVLTVTFIPLLSMPTEPDATGPTTDPNALFTVHVLEEQFSPVLGPNDIYISSIVYSEDRLTYEEETYYISGYNIASLINSNFWLRVELTEQGKSIYRDDLYPSIHCMSDYLSSSAIPEVYNNFTVIPYYADEEHTKILGWLVWGKLNRDDTIIISLPEFEFLVSTPIRVTPYFSVSQFYIQPTFVSRQDSSYSLRFGDVSLSIDPTVAEIADDVCSADFWVYIKLSDDGRELLGSDQYFLNYESTPTMGAQGYISGFPCYSYVHPDVISGYILYGSNSMNLHSITISSNTKKLTYPDLVEITPYIRQDQAVKMSTQQLIDHILSNKGITDDLLDDTPTGTLMQHYPAFEEFLNRSDAGQLLMDQIAPEETDSPATTLWLRWSNYWYPDDNNISTLPIYPAELANVTHYYAPPILDSVESETGVEYYLTTSDGRYIIDAQSMNMENLSFCFRLELNAIAYDLISDFSRITWMFEPLTSFRPESAIPYYTDASKEKIAGWFFYGPERITSISSVYVGDTSVYPGTITVQYFETEDPYDHMTTEILVQYVMTNENITNAILNPDPGPDDWMAYLCDLYPALKELFTRANTGNYLQDWLTDHGEDAEVVLKLYAYWAFSLHC